MSSSKCSFTCICGIFLPLNPSTTTVYARSAFYPSLRFTLSLQSPFYPQSHFTPGPQSAVCSPQSSFYTDRFSKHPYILDIFKVDSEYLRFPFKVKVDYFILYSILVSTFVIFLLLFSMNKRKRTNEASRL